MGLFDFLTKQKETQTVTDSRNPDTKAYDQAIANIVNRYGGQYQPAKPYEGKFTAGMTPYESTGLEKYLTGYLNQPDVSSQLGNVRDYLNKQITGQFDPYASEQYKAFRDTAQYNKEQAVKGLKGQLGASNKFFSSERVNKEGDINAQVGLGLNEKLAQLQDQERTRAASAVPYATGLEQYISGIPLQKAQAATSVGSLPRLLEQADLESVYQDFLRRQKEGADVFSIGSRMSNQPLDIQVNRNPSFLQSITPLLSTAAGSIFGLGGLFGQTLPSASSTPWPVSTFR